MSVATDLIFENTYARLPESFYARVAPTPVPAPRLLRLNRPLAGELGLDPAWLASPDGVAMLAGNRVPESSRPLAMAYAGHQFGNFVPQLGDGRAVLLGELVDAAGVRRDVHLKGAGRTPFSRGGDGRAVLGPVIREYLGSEAMAALGVPTTRALAMVATGQSHFREAVEPGAILARVARSHVRVGTFEYFAARDDREAVQRLADYVIRRHYPEVAGAGEPYLELLRQVALRSGELIASWMMVGFIHGVMNTDNMSVAGETIDYGPFAFMDAYHPETVFSSIDTGGRYAFNQQPRIGYWNLARLATALMPLLGGSRDRAVRSAEEALDAYVDRFEQAYQAGLRTKLGLAEAREGDRGLAHDLLRAMAAGGADFTLTFRRLSEVDARDASVDGPVRELFDDPAVFDAWAARWRERLAAESRADAERRRAMRAVNPAFVLRNHLAQQAVDAAAREQDLGPFEDLLTVLSAPCDDHPGMERYARPPRPGEEVPVTFCGT
ncbi:MAG TPA: YdiU family protein [Gammaproteobacteria bacterium]|nr:YdiU family protein [Gammaproteobacteria bacterium]